MAEFIWTTHAKQRLADRKIPTDFVMQALAHPDRKQPAKDGSIAFEKRINHQTVAAIIKQNEAGEYIILSCWIDPPNPGTKDFKSKERYRMTQKASGWKKFWLAFLTQIGL